MLAGKPSQAAMPDSLAAYSVQLRAWIELQVQSMIGPLRGFVDAELRSTKQAQTELTDANSSLLAVVEGLSQEVAKLHAAVSDFQLSSQLHSLVNTSALVPARDDGLAGEIARQRQGLAELEQRVLSLQTEVMGRMHVAPMAPEMNQLLADAETRIGQQALLVIQSKSEECQQECRQEIHAAIGRMKMQPSLTQSQEQSIEDLRAEVAAAFREEAQTVAALDEQIWLTDRRLGHRIEALTDMLQGRSPRSLKDDALAGPHQRLFSSASRRSKSLGPPLGKQLLRDQDAYSLS